ncbi:hypothetical protein VTN77DRAFT_6544 [Rasamsonia byssochlamydoides]|uniref:uncharacterized protein n=1 Tax=Rasamsonia byssochlamydoides TaxID=89139 RepID=UPI003742100A
MLCPFSVDRQLCFELDNLTAESMQNSSQHLPGYPRLKLCDKNAILDFLEQELCSRDLDRIADRLWWMSKQDSASISPLHRQKVKRRKVIVTEDPKLHLVWMYDRIFIKPLPKYLLSHKFWDVYLCQLDSPQTRGRVDRIRRAALGYLRTYYHLVRYESDFRMAMGHGDAGAENARLLPSGITWEQFCAFSSDFPKIRDSDVSGRYAYGEIRLTRLNFYAPLLLGRSHFQRVEYQYGAYFARLYPPMLFVFAIFSLLLGGFQVVLAAQQIAPVVWDQHALLSTGFWFSVVVICCLVALMLTLFCVLVFKIGREWRYAIRDRLRSLEEGAEKKV